MYVLYLKYKALYKCVCECTPNEFPKEFKENCMFEARAYSNLYKANDRNSPRSDACGGGGGDSDGRSI